MDHDIRKICRDQNKSLFDKFYETHSEMLNRKNKKKIKNDKFRKNKKVKKTTKKVKVRRNIIEEENEDN